MATTSRPAATPTSLTQWNASQQESAQRVDPARVVDSLQQTLRQRGLPAWVELGLSLERAHTQAAATQGLTRAALKRVLHEHALGVTEAESRALWRVVAAHEDARSTADAVKNLLCGQLTGRRLELVESVFDQLDAHEQQHHGYLPMSAILARHEASRHPSVMFGEQTAAQVQEECVAALQALTRATTTTMTANGQAVPLVNRFQWMTLFQCVRGHAPSDEFFDLVMKRTWGASATTSLLNTTTTSMATKPLPQPLPPPAPTDPTKLTPGSDQGASLTVLTTADRSQPVLSRNKSLNSGGLDARKSGDSPRAAHTTIEFLRGAELAACMVDPSLRLPTPSPRSSARTTALSSSPRASSSSLPVTSPSSCTMGSMDAGTLSVQVRLRRVIQRRGLPYLVALTRRIRTQDTDGDGQLTQLQFKRSLQLDDDHSERPSIQDSDLRALFQWLDRDHRGLVSVSDTLACVRDTMNPRRQQLVATAFAMVAHALNESSPPSFIVSLEPQEVVQRYDARRHPDVIAGRRTEAQVFQDFIENFDLEATTPTKNGDEEAEATSTANRITAAMWDNYYQNVSAFIADDDLFELLVRNAWHLPAPTPTTSSQWSNGTSATTVPSTAASPIARPRGYSAGHGSREALAILQPELLGTRQDSPLARDSQRKHGYGNPDPSSPSTHQSKALRRVMHQLRAMLKQQGLMGFLALQHQCQIHSPGCHASASANANANANASRATLPLTLPAFQRAVHDAHVRTVSGQDLALVFDWFDSNHDGVMDAHTFLAALRGPLPEHRALLVRMAFDALDTTRRGALELRSLMSRVTVQRHPDVRAGRQSETEALTSFEASLAVVTIAAPAEWNKPTLSMGKVVNFTGWMTFHENLSAALDDDDAFDCFLRSVWPLSGVPSRASLVAAMTGSKCPSGSNAIASSSASSILPSGLASTSPRSTTRPRHPNNHSDAMMGCLGGSNNSTTDHQRRASSPSRSSASPSPRGNISSFTTAMPAGVEAILTRLRAELITQGEYGFCLLSRSVRRAAAEEAGGDQLTLRALRRALSESGLALAGPGANANMDLRLLFQYLDGENRGVIACTAFLTSVREPLTPRRLRAVQEVFQMLSRDGGGSALDASAMVEAFDANKHPSVCSGQASAEQVFCDFLESFDVAPSEENGSQDGDGASVSYSQWLHFYENVSAGIASDETFESLLRSVWGLGLPGTMSNSNERVSPSPPEEHPPFLPDDTSNRNGHTSGNVSAASNVSTAQARTFQDPGSHHKQSDQVSKEKTPTTTLQDAIKGKTLADVSRLYPVTESSSAVPADALWLALRHRVQQQRVNEVAALRKDLHQAADARTGHLSAGQCARVLSESVLAVTLSEAQCLAMFEWLAATQVVSTPAPSSASPSYSTLPISALLPALLGSLSAAGKTRVRQVFAMLQGETTNGRVFASTLARCFRAERHPDVALGFISAAQAFQEFAASVDVAEACEGHVHGHGEDGDGDGTISMDCLERFCADLRATLPSDTHWDVVMRDCFQPPTSMSGGYCQ